jgi:predicted RNase H-like HicB family nuclease
MTKKKTKVDDDFDPAILAKAREIANSYTLIFEPDEELGYVGRVRELPGVLADGKTIEQCAKATLFGVETVVASQLESGETPPAPASREKRSEQVNIRLTPHEKETLQEEASRRGFRGVADFLRASAVDMLTHRHART